MAAMEWDHHIQSTYLEMFHSKIDELQGLNEVVHCPAGKELVVDTVQVVVTRILSKR